MNQAQRQMIAKMKAKIAEKHAAAKTDAERAEAEREWAALLDAEKNACTAF